MPKRTVKAIAKTVTIAPIPYTDTPPKIIITPTIPRRQSTLKFCACGTRNSSLPFIFQLCIACIMSHEGRNKKQCDEFAARKATILTGLTAFIYGNTPMRVRVLMETPKSRYEIVIIDSDTPDLFIIRVYEGQSILVESKKLAHLDALKEYCKRAEEFITKDN